MKTIAIHRTYEEMDGKRVAMIFRCSGTEIVKQDEDLFEKWASKEKKGLEIRATFSNPYDRLLAALSSLPGCVVKTANWHATGIEKNLAPEIIVARFMALSSELFRQIRPRQDILELRQVVSMRNTLMDYRKRCDLAIQSTGRASGIANKKDQLEVEAISEAFKGVHEIQFAETNSEKFFERLISEQAAKIEECVVFNAIADISGAFGSAASVVAFTGGLERFNRVSSLWHYGGQHVDNGVAPKKKRGEAISWNPKLRTALYLLGTSLIKNTKNKWRKFYEDEYGREMAVHAEKCQKCATENQIKSHSGGRARRKLVKEILRLWFEAVKGPERT